MSAVRRFAVVAAAATLLLGTASTTNAEDIDGTPKGDRLTGTLERDRIISGGGDDVIKARDGADKVRSGAGNDVINLGRGKATDEDIDFADGGLGDDVLRGGPGPDNLVDGRGTGNDALRGGPGGDQVAYFDSRDDLDTLVSCEDVTQRSDARHAAWRS